MRKSIITSLMAMTTILAMGTLTAQAFSLSKFTSNSRLSTGNWVKIAVDADGIYQITATELAELGFNNLERVQVYGQGGHIISEVMDGTFVDDLQPVPTMVVDDKVVFYAQGPVSRKMIDNTNVYPYYTHTLNGYANHGYYFITETDNPTRVTQQDATTAGSNWVTSSYSLFRHESELTSVGFTGKQLLGESLLPNGVTIDYDLPLLSDSTIVIHLGAAGHVTEQAAYVKVNVVGDANIPYFTTENKIRVVNVNNEPHRHYNTIYPTRSFKLADPKEHGQLYIYIYNPSNATIRLALLDYIDITYKRLNSFATDETSFAMGFAMTYNDTQVVMPGTDSLTVVWDVTDPQNMRQMQLSPAINEQGDTVGMSFTPGARSLPSQYFAFRPHQEHATISNATPIENQNLHGLTTPDMLIVTNQYFLSEAERLAQIHRNHDGMTVHVVDQEQVFNEFSSGTPDASAIRLLCKMLYDRNNTKFKNLLMFGPASYDYRGITTDKANRVISYETDNGDSDANSFTTDDFFTMLADNSGYDLTTSEMKMGVGRLTPVDLKQAKQDVDKIAQYVLTPDYGSWRNRYSIWADTGDDDIHQLQGEGIDSLIQYTLHAPLITDKTYVDMYPLEGSVSSEARRHISDMLDGGTFYATYMGHAGTKVLTKSRMWTVNNVHNQKYDHLPILSTFCCDVARFDGNDQGIAEIMLHQPGGGAIALLTSCREVEAINNDLLNQAFTTALFGYNNTAQMTTLGQAYMQAKRSSITNSSQIGSYNKMSFYLLGDPAIKFLYPKPLFNLTTINGINVSTTSTLVELSPMQQVTVEADVLRPGSTQVNTNFNGDATLAIYDQQKFLKTVARTSTNKRGGDIYYSRDLLVEVEGRVENGHFIGTAVMPRYFKAQPGETLSIHVYAHQDNSSEMVNGSTTQVVAAAYDEEKAVQDDAAPVIQEMYLNEKSTFDQGGTVPSNSILHITATDDVAFNNQGVGVGCTAQLILDEGAKHYSQIKNYVGLTDGGKALQLDFPINGLTAGQHTLTFSVQDVAGNNVQRTIAFMVGEQSKLALKTDELVAIDEATVDLEDTDVTYIPAMTLKVVNARGELVWSDTTASFPYAWNLKNNQGERVAPGLYKLFGQYNDGTAYGGTNIMPIIVMEPVR